MGHRDPRGNLQHAHAAGGAGCRAGEAGPCTCKPDGSADHGALSHLVMFSRNGRKFSSYDASVSHLQFVNQSLIALYKKNNADFLLKMMHMRGIYIYVFMLCVIVVMYRPLILTMSTILRTG